MARKLVDRKLERAVVATVPTFATDLTAATLVEILSVEDFDDSEARLYWRAIEGLVAERGGWLTLGQVLERAGRSVTEWGLFRQPAEEIAVNIVGRAELVRHAEVLKQMAEARRAKIIFQSGLQLIESDAMPNEDIVKLTQDRLLEVHSVVPAVPMPRSFRDAVATPVEERFDWAVEGWLERKDRVIVTGGEGKGKATLLRQFLIQLGVGFHPWKGPDMCTPMVGLHVDLQDGTRRNEREFAMIAERTGVEPFDHLYMESRNGGVNVIRNAADRRWLEGLIRTTRPDVVALGPLSRLISGEDRTDAVAMQTLMTFIDLMRDRYDIIWFLEAHAAKAGSGASRSWVPFGSQAFMEWPDVGIGLSPMAKTNPPRANLIDWRGNRDVLSKIWPARVVWGEFWPWVPVDVPHPSMRHRSKVAGLRQPTDNDPGAQDDDPPPAGSRTSEKPF